ncbi:MAG: FAD:protein FMN transferase [Pirellulales bacterium]|nr:FAD:protein FMN transferase [Pirellulales bacterium]
MTTSAAKPAGGFVWIGLAFSIGVATSGLSVACGMEAGIVSFFGPTMGTRYRVSLAVQAANLDMPESTGPLQKMGQPSIQSRVQPLVEGLLAEIEGQMSTYDPESELSQFNRSESTEWFTVSAGTAHCVAYALEIAEKTAGAFDPTVGPIVNLWGFGPHTRPREPPADETIVQALDRIGHQYVAVRAHPPALRKMRPTVNLDLSAIAKGFAVDQVSTLLKAQGFRAAMVEIGGEVRTSGTKQGSAPWRIAIQKPATGAGEFQEILDLTSAAIATSGDYQNYYEYDGVRYSHTIDPQTGRPVQHQLAVVSVQADTCMESDALATALLVMGEQRGYDWCVRQDVAALFQTRQEDKIVSVATPRFEQLHRAPLREPRKQESMIWQTFLLAGAVFLVAILGMAVGVIVSHRRLKGTCGGLANLRDKQGNPVCDACTDPAPDCDGVGSKASANFSSQDGPY